MTGTERLLGLLAMAALAVLPFESDQLALAAGPLRITIPEALVAATLVTAAGASLTEWGRTALRRVWPFATATGLFVVALAVSAICAPEHRDLALKYVCRLAGGGAFGVVVAMLVATDRHVTPRLMLAFAAGVVVASVIGVLEFVWPEVVVPHLALFRANAIYAAGSVRAASTYGYPNTMATSIAMALPIVVVRASGWLGRWWIGAILVAVLSVALVASFSRGGLIAAVSGLVVVAVVAWSLAERRLASHAFAATALIGFVWLGAWLGAAQLARRGTVVDSRHLLSASIQPSSASLAATPGAEAAMPVTLTNTGALAWTTTDAAPFTLVSRWYDRQGSEVTVEGARTFLPTLVAPGEAFVANGTYVVPAAEGDYWLVWDVYVENRVRLGDIGTARSAVRVAVRNDIEQADVAIRGWAPGDGVTQSPEHGVSNQVYVPPGRRLLWRAAVSMFREHSLLGVGPDNYRLSYGRYLGLDAWDVRVYANNLYLELLATSGIVGFGSFLAVLVVLFRRIRTILAQSASWIVGDTIAIAAIACLAVVLVHGLVDYFLEFTCGYVAFWTWAGVLAGFGAPARTQEST